MSCKAMFEQVDTAFQKGMIEHSAAAQHQIESTHSQLVLALRVCLHNAHVWIRIIYFSVILDDLLVVETVAGPVMMLG